MKNKTLKIHKSKSFLDKMAWETYLALVGSVLFSGIATSTAVIFSPFLLQYLIETLPLMVLLTFFGYRYLLDKSEKNYVVGGIFSALFVFVGFYIFAQIFFSSLPLFYIIDSAGFLFFFMQIFSRARR